MANTTLSVIENINKNQCNSEEKITLDHIAAYINLIIATLKWSLELIYQNFFVILSILILVLILFVLYKSYLSMDVYIKDSTEIGFDHIPAGPDRSRRIAQIELSRRFGSKIPPPYPNGWFAVAEVSDVKEGKVLAVDALGQNLCVYRGTDGIARCVDAYCPHLGANFAVGGTVCGNCIECPFHKWKFGADGVLVSVPGVETVPKGVSVRTWTTAEADGIIWIWHDAEGRPPQWKMENTPELTNYTCRGTNIFTVNCHIQEIPENGADVTHLHAVHSESLITKLGEKYPFLLNFIGFHCWTAEWSWEQGHSTSLKLTHDYNIMKMNILHIDVEASQIGPGQVRLYVKTPFGPVLIMQTVTPIGPSLQKVIHRVFTPWYNAPMGIFINRTEAYQFERDVVIWNNKRYMAAPSYVKADKTIRNFRNWFSQFYSENSISFRDAVSNGLDW